jgi:hypothetical protein
VFGDRNLVCACPSIESYQDALAASLPVERACAAPAPAANVCATYLEETTMSLSVFDLFKIGIGPPAPTPSARCAPPRALPKAAP